MAELKTARRNIIVDILVVLFGISSWVAVNGLWVELPVLVNNLPESWKLASYIVIVSQIANLGPIAFSAARRKWSLKVFEVPIIHVSLAVVILSCIFLSVFWDATTYISGELHSTALLVLTFFISCVDCTSSLLYLPFLANFKEEYVIPYMIGSGLSGPIPGMLAVAQGVGGYAECKNVNVMNMTEVGNVTDIAAVPYYPPPRFSVNTFFAVLSVQMIISWVAFVLLNKLPVARKEKAPLIPTSQISNPSWMGKLQSTVKRDLELSSGKPASPDQSLLEKPDSSDRKYFILLAIQGLICALHNALLSIQTYSCLPYGSATYHLTVILSSFANPICCFIAMFLPITSVRSVFSVTIFCMAWGIYILITSLLSPIPPLVGTALGSFLVVLAWVIVIGLISFIKACIVTILRREGGKAALFQGGVVTQTGSAIGAFVMFVLLEFTTVFHVYSPCT